MFTAKNNFSNLQVSVYTGTHGDENHYLRPVKRKLPTASKTAVGR